jgi:alkylation response protein AidB-like acyl-CoA dehydrogenase
VVTPVKWRPPNVVNGVKRYISNASVADTYIVYGISDPGAPARRDMSALVVPAGARGPSFPRRYNFMGHRGAVVGEVAFRDCRVPADYLPGAPGKGFAIMLSMFNLKRVMLGGAGPGSCWCRP